MAHKHVEATGESNFDVFAYGISAENLLPPRLPMTPQLSVAEFGKYVLSDRFGPQCFNRQYTAIIYFMPVFLPASLWWMFASTAASQTCRLCPRPWCNLIDACPDTGMALHLKVARHTVRHIPVSQWRQVSLSLTDPSKGILSLDRLITCVAIVGEPQVDPKALPMGKRPSLLV